MKQHYHIAFQLSLDEIPKVVEFIDGLRGMSTKSADEVFEVDPTTNSEAVVSLKLSPKSEIYVNVQDIRIAAKKCYATHGAPALAGVLKEFEVENISGLDQSMYGEFLEALEQLNVTATT